MQAWGNVRATRRRPASLLASLRRARYGVAALAFVALAGYALQPVACSARAAPTQPAQAAGPVTVVPVAVPAGDPPHPEAPCCATHEAVAAQLVHKLALALPETSFPALPAARSVMTRPSAPSALADRASHLRDASRATPYHARTTRRLF